MSTRLRVLHVITRLDRGGSAENTLLTVAGMDPDRYDVTLAVGVTVDDPGPTAAAARARGVRFVDVPGLVRAPSPVQDLRAGLALRRLLHSEPWDLVHTHTSKAGIIGRWAAHRARVRAIVHTPHGHVFYGYYGAMVTRAFIQLERLAAGWCHRLVALTAADRQDHLRFGVGRPEQWEVVHSGVDFRPLDVTTTPAAALRQQLGLAPDDLVVGTLGRLAAVKGQADLIRAFAGLHRQRPKARLLLIGDGEEAGTLRALAQDIGVHEQIVFAGWCDNVGDMLRLLDIFVLPSHNEGMGKALVEAMYLQRPVIATRVGGVPELITDQMHGLLVEARDHEQLTAALLRLADEPALRLQLAQQGAVRARDYGSHSMVEKLCCVYEELVAPEPGTRREAAVALPAS